jgi:signal transduction histidine kinase
VRRSAPAEAEGALRSLHKLLTIEMGMMLESYSESLTARIRQIERETLHERLTRAEHLAQIGQLAASLAHEIKNPLAGISGAIQVIREELSQSDHRRPILEEVLRQIDRLDRTVKDLLIYARPKPPQRQPCDINSVIARILTLLRKEPELQHVRIETLEATALPRVEADEHQVEQLLLNVLLNAAQASQPGDVVRIQTRAFGDYVELAVTDHGCGMSPELIDRAVEPFYTTKARGSGLGLPICQKIAEAHGGELRIESQPGRGTTVRAILPQRSAVPLTERS